MNHTILLLYFFAFACIASGLTNISSFVGILIARIRHRRASPRPLFGWWQLVSLALGVAVITMLIWAQIYLGDWTPEGGFLLYVAGLYFIGMLFSLVRATYNLQAGSIGKYVTPIFLCFVGAGLLWTSTFFGAGISLFSRPVTVTNVEHFSQINGLFHSGWTTIEHEDGRSALAETSSRGREYVKIGDVVWVNGLTGEATAKTQYITSLSLIILACGNIATAIAWMTKMRVAT